MEKNGNYSCRMPKYDDKKKRREKKGEKKSRGNLDESQV